MSAQIWRQDGGKTVNSNRIALDRSAFFRVASGDGRVVLCDAESNRKVVVETLRSLAELVIWGDQHDARFFDFFAEKHLLSHFNRILRQPANQRGEVPQQVACHRL